MHSSKIAIVTPVFNDWVSFGMLINDLSKLANEFDIKIQVIAVDDCSTLKNYPYDLSFSKNLKITILRLRINLGHQRSIAIGLCETQSHKDLDGVVVMDCDGEDKVEDIFQLMYKYSSSITVAKRSSRTESRGFIIFYKMYKLFFRILSGHLIDFGNFCYLPADKLESLIYSPNIWNHLAATIIKSKIPIKRISTARGKRYQGKSKLNFADLVIHGLGAMSVFIDYIFARLLYFLVIFITLIAFLSILIIGIRIFTTLSTPGWTTTLLGIFMITGLQAIIITLISAFMVLNSRTNKEFIPASEASFFVVERINIY